MNQDNDERFVLTAAEGDEQIDRLLRGEPVSKRKAFPVSVPRKEQTIPVAPETPLEGTVTAMMVHKSAFFLWRASANEARIDVHTRDPDIVLKPRQALSIESSALAKTAFDAIRASSSSLVSLRVAFPSDPFQQPLLVAGLQRSLSLSTHISRLHIDGFPALPDDLFAAVSGLGSLCELRITACENLRSNHVSTFPKTLTNLDLSGTKFDGSDLVRFELLSSLRLSRCWQLDGERVARSIGSLHLRSLDLSSSAVSEMAVPLVSGFLRDQKILRELRLESCKNAVPSLLQLAASSRNMLPRLRMLDISGCPMMREDAVAFSESSVVRHIAVLLVRKCPGITDAEISFIRSINRSIRIDSTGCQDVENQPGQAAIFGESSEGEDDACRCWKYEIPRNCYLAREWCSVNQCVPAEVSLWTAGTPPAVIKLTELKSGLALNARVEGTAVCRVEDSQRYFVLNLGGSRVGVGFQSREESTQFSDIVSRFLPSGIPVHRKGGDPAAVPAAPLLASVAPSPPPRVVQPSTSPTLPSLPSSTSLAATASGQPPPGSPSDLASTVKAVPGEARAKDEDEDDEEEESTPGRRRDAREIRGQEPEVSVEETQVRATRASLAPPSEKGIAAAYEAAIAGKPQHEAPHPPQPAPAATASAEAKEPESSSGTVERKHVEEDSSMAKWWKHRKHVFMLSIAGKPIYSRYGDEQKLAPFMASLMALVSFVADTNDTLRYFVAGRRRVVFFLRGPVYMVAVCNTGESQSELVRQLFYIHSQVVSILTFSSIGKIFAKRPDFDLRGLLSGTDRVIDNLIHQMNHNAALMLNAVHPLPLPAAVRSNIETALLAAACPELLFALLFNHTSLIHMARPRRFTLDPVDIHILMNFVNSASSFRSNRSWTPLCLPMFDDKGFLHAYICYLTHDVCLVLLSAKVDAFYRLNECKDIIASQLEATGALAAISEACAKPHYRPSAIGSPNLLHFVYKTTSSRQMTAPALDAPYNTPADQKRLFRTYQRVRMRVEGPLGMPHKVYYHVSQAETIVAWVTKGFELYATYGPLESKSQAIKACNKIIVWILQQEADLFILNSPVW